MPTHNKPPKKFSLLGRLTKGLVISWLFLITPSWASFAPSSVAEELIYTSLKSYYPEAKLKWPKEVSQLYQQQNFSYLWLTSSLELIDAAKELKDDLEPWLALDTNNEANLAKLKKYKNIKFLLSQLPFIDLPRQRLAADFWLTDLFLSYQEDLLTRYWPKQDEDEDHGIVNKYENWDHWPNTTPESSLAEAFPTWLHQLNQGTSASQLLSQLMANSRPTSHYYQPLRQAFTKFSQLHQLATWPKLEKELSLGATGAEVTHLALQLYYHEDLTQLEDYLPTQSQQPVFDEQLKAALISFQQRHQLGLTATTNSATRHWLNLTPKARLNILAANIKRLHHLPKQLHPQHLMLNMASQQLSYQVAGQEELAMKIIVGRPGLRTPIMNQWLTSLVINPIWNVPPNLAKRSILPRALNNPNYLAQNNYEVLDGWHTPSRKAKLNRQLAATFGERGNNLRIIQKAGKNNQLGKVKFRLSNQQAIYLHDTPFTQGFNRQERNISSGCVRLENAEALVAKILENSGFSSRQIEQVYTLEEEKYLRVNPRVAVYLMYWTVVANKEGQLEWFNDIYFKDQPEPATKLAKQTTG